MIVYWVGFPVVYDCSGGLGVWGFSVGHVFVFGWDHGLDRNQTSPFFTRKFTHDSVVPSWLELSYDELVDWRAKRVITNNNFAYALNWLCDGKRSAMGLSHVTDPLPWMRDCSDPVEEVDVLARYNVDVLNASRPGSDEGEEDIMRDMLSGGNGRRDQGFGPSSKSYWFIYL